MRGALTPSSPGGRLAALLVLLAALLALVAGCSDDDGAELPPPGQPGALAAFLPAGSAVYFDVTTDEESEQWTQAEALAGHFPGFPGLLRDLEDDLTAEGVTFDQLRAVAGDRIAFALPTFNLQSDEDPPVLILAEIAEGQEEAALDLLMSGESELVSAGEHEGVEYFTDDESALAITDGALVAAIGPESERDLFAALDAHDDADTTLAAQPAFTDALAELPEETAATGFVDIAGIFRSVLEDVPELQDLDVVSLDEDTALGVAAVAEAEGLHITGSMVNGPEAAGGGFAPTLLDRAPADAIAYLGISDAAGAVSQGITGAEGEAAEGLRDQVEFFSRQLQAALGISTDDLAFLFGGEQAIVVTPGVEFPGVAILLKVDDPARATSVLERLRAGVPEILGVTGAPGAGRQFRQVPLDNGVQGWELPILPGLSIVYGVDDDVVILGTSTDAVRQVQTPQGSLSGSPAFQAGTARVPDEVGGLFLVDIQRVIGALEAAGILGDLPRELLENLEPLGGVTAWSGTDQRTFEAFLSIGE